MSELARADLARKCRWIMTALLLLLPAAGLPGCGRGAADDAEKLHGTWAGPDGGVVTFGPGNTIKVWTEEEAGAGK